MDIKDQEFIDHAIQCARSYAKLFSTNIFAIHHLSTTLEISYQEAEKLFYKHD